MRYYRIAAFLQNHNESNDAHLIINKAHELKYHVSLRTVKIYSLF